MCVVLATTNALTPCLSRYIFPGLGLGSVLSRASVVSDGMIYAASIAVADSLSDEELAMGMVFPDVNRIREVSLRVAMYVIQAAQKEGIARNKDVHGLEGANLHQYVEDKMYDPVYVPLVHSYR